jgi:hypothetical protein
MADSDIEMGDDGTGATPSDPQNVSASAINNVDLTPLLSWNLAFNQGSRHEDQASLYDGQINPVSTGGPSWDYAAPAHIQYGISNRTYTSPYQNPQASIGSSTQIAPSRSQAGTGATITDPGSDGGHKRKRTPDHPGNQGDGNQGSKRQRTSSTARFGLRCSHCRAGGHNDQPCDAEHERKIECSQCTNYREEHARARKDHGCFFGEEQYYRKYHMNHLARPERLMSKRCDGCRAIRRNDCDGDRILEIGCTSCLRRAQTRDGLVCRFNAKVMRERPEVRRPWFRHSCDHCAHNGLECSWLNSFAIADACENCAAEQITCSSYAVRVGQLYEANPQYERGPVVREKDASISENRDSRPWVRTDENLVTAPRTGDPPTRIQCALCNVTDSRCSYYPSNRDKACQRCMAFGLPCVSQQHVTLTVYPPGSRELVGWGATNWNGFLICRNCEAKQRNCDRKRPCDCCVEHNEAAMCDPFVKKFRSGTIPRDTYGANQPEYYMALGYGPAGVYSRREDHDPAILLGPSDPIYNWATRHPDEPYKLAKRGLPDTENQDAAKPWYKIQQPRRQLPYETARSKYLAGISALDPRSETMEGVERTQAGILFQIPIDPALSSTAGRSLEGYVNSNVPAVPPLPNELVFSFPPFQQSAEDTQNAGDWGEDIQLMAAEKDELDSLIYDGFGDTRFAEFNLQVDPPEGAFEDDVIEGSPDPAEKLFSLRLLHRYPFLQRAPFVTKGQLGRKEFLLRKFDNPAKKVLGSIAKRTSPLGGLDTLVTGSACQELVRLDEKCGKVLSEGTCCESRLHASWHPYPLCKDCNTRSKQHLFQGSRPITREEFLAMRAYACVECTEHMALTVMHYDTAGPITGCSCATKLLDRMLCQHHRYGLAVKMLKQTILMREWRLAAFGTEVCFRCRSKNGVDSYAFQGQNGNVSGVNIWACFVCQEVSYGDQDTVPGIHLGFNPPPIAAH